MPSKRSDGGLPEARVVGRAAKVKPKAPAPTVSREDCGDEFAALIPMLLLLLILVLILWGAAR